MNIPLLNRSFEMPADGWHQLMPLGEFPIMVNDNGKPKKLIQVIDKAAMESMVNRFRQEAAQPNFPGILIDYDHFSHDADKSSEAAGWITDLQNRADGLWAKVKWSDSGEAAVKGGRYRFPSPVWSPDDCQDLGNSRLRPMRLDRVGLTNDPNLKGLVPLSNRRDDAAATQTKTKENMNPKILALLGLAADADENAAIEAINALKNRVSKEDHDELKNRHDALLASLVDADLESFKDVIADKEAVKTQLLANRDATLKFLRGIKKPEAPKPLHNRNTAGTPPPLTGAKKEAARAQQQRAAVEAYRLKNRCSHEQAWQAVKNAQPELFKNEEKED